MTAWEIRHWHRNRFSLTCYRLAKDGTQLSRQVACYGPRHVLAHLKARLEQVRRP